METEQITRKLAALKKKQAEILETWQKTGNKDLIQFITDFLPKALNAERCSIFIVDPTRSDVWIQSGTGLSEKAVSVPLEATSIVGRVIKSGVYLVADNMEDVVGAHDVAAAKTGFVTRSALCVPVHNSSADKVIGAIQLLNKTNPYSEKDRKTIERLAMLLQKNMEQIYQRQELLNISNEMGQMIQKLERQLIKANLEKGASGNP